MKANLQPPKIAEIDHNLEHEMAFLNVIHSPAKLHLICGEIDNLDQTRRAQIVVVSCSTGRVTGRPRAASA